MTNTPDNMHRMKYGKDWHAAWAKGQTGWHREDVSPSLIQYAHLLNLKPGNTLLVPLCGASVDMLWARKQGWHVLGIDLSSTAIETFVTRHQLTGSWHGTRFDGNGLTLLCKDIFHVADEALGQVQAVYDRAAMIALPGDIRKAYLQHLRTHCPRDTPILTEVLTYDPPCPGEPPFSVCDNQLQNILKLKNCRQLNSQATHDVPPRLLNRNTRTQVFLATL